MQHSKYCCRSSRFNAVTDAANALAGVTESLFSPCRATSESTVCSICSFSDEISAMRRISSAFGSLLGAALTPGAMHASDQPVTPFDAPTEEAKTILSDSCSYPEG